MVKNIVDIIHVSMALMCQSLSCAPAIVKNGLVLHCVASNLCVGPPWYGATSPGKGQGDGGSPVELHEQKTIGHNKYFGDIAAGGWALIVQERGSQYASK